MRREVCADLGEQRAGRVLVGLSHGLVAGHATRGTTGHEMGLCLAEPVTRLCVDAKRPLGKVESQGCITPTELGGGEHGEGLALEEPVPTLAGQVEGLREVVGGTAGDP